MFQWNTRIATVFIVSAAMATTAAAQPQHKKGEERQPRAQQPAKLPTIAAPVRVTLLSERTLRIEPDDVCTIMTATTEDGRTTICAIGRKRGA